MVFSLSQTIFRISSANKTQGHDNKFNVERRGATEKLGVLI